MMEEFLAPGTAPVPPALYPAGETELAFILPYLGGVSGSAGLTDANVFTALQTMLAGSDHCLDDGNGAAISYPLSLCHTNSGGVGLEGIGAGLKLETETANVEGSVETIGWLQAQTTAIGPGVTDSNLQIHVLDEGTEAEVMKLSGRHVDILLTPLSDDTLGMLNLGDGGFGGDSDEFAGDSNGTVIAANSPVTFEGDLLNLERAGLSRLRVRGDGRVGIGATTAPTGVLHVTRAAKLVPDPNFLSYLKVTGAADTFVQPSDEPTDIFFDFARTVQLDTGDRAAVRSMRISGVTLSAVGASTVTEAATLAINGGPAAGTNVTLTNSYALWVTGTARFDPGAQPHVWKLPQDDVAPGAIVGRIPVNIGGVTRYIAYHAA